MITLLYSGYYDIENSKTPFNVDPFFYYLTQCELPNILVLKLNSKYYVNIDLPDNLWYDSDYYNNILKKCFNAKLISLDEIISKIKNKEIQSIPIIKKHPKWIKFMSLNIDITSISNKVNKKRLIKSTSEKLCIEQACNFTSQGIKFILKNAKPNMTQKQLIGLFKYRLSQSNIDRLSFNPIAAHNKYNKYLHYISKDINIKPGSLILLDVGCKYKHYCSDISRCFPISGRFSKKQKDIYNIVLTTLKYALRQIKPGVLWETFNKKVRLKLYQECAKLKLVKTITNDDEKIKLTKLLLPHLIGHNVGLETHDGDNIETFKVNMVVAIEIGIYFRKIKNPHILVTKWSEYETIGGIRLEDTVIVTRSGHKNLSKVSKEIDGIETLMK